jgi:uncharacterized protein YjbI with pentapeptide repeats
VIAAVTSVGSLAFGWLSHNASQEEIALTEQSQITDRYSKAVEQVGRPGPENLGIRLGGIYALERLAHDSPRDQPTMIEVLSAFIRTTARPTPSTPCLHEPPDADVQAALTVLIRRDLDQDNNIYVDLHGACLAFADLHASYLNDANFTGTDLTGADLDEATLPGARFDKANLRGAHLAAYLVHARLTNADLTAAQLFGGNFSNTDLTNANLTAANLEITPLTGANLTHANLAHANLNSAILDGSNLTGTNLSGADVRKVLRDESTHIANTVTDTTTLGQWW